jgi:hypothetical protein
VAGINTEIINLMYHNDLYYVGPIYVGSNYDLGYVSYDTDFYWFAISTVDCSTCP